MGYQTCIFWAGFSQPRWLRCGSKTTCCREWVQQSAFFMYLFAHIEDVHHKISEYCFLIEQSRKNRPVGNVRQKDTNYLRIIVHIGFIRSRENKTNEIGKC